MISVASLKVGGPSGAGSAQRQIESYWSAGVEAGAVVQITDSEIDDWSEIYRHRCLAQWEAEVVPSPDSPIRARFAVTSQTADGQTARVEQAILSRLGRGISTRGW